MVDALSRARRWARPDGCVIDLRPASVHPAVELGLADGTVLHVGGLVVQDARSHRHAAADAALAAAIDRRLFRIQAEQEFAFFRYPESPEELRDHIAAKWAETRMDDATCQHASVMMRQHAGSRLRLREQVGMRVLLAR